MKKLRTITIDETKINTDCPEDVYNLLIDLKIEFKKDEKLMIVDSNSNLLGWTEDELLYSDKQLIKLVLI